MICGVWCYMGLGYDVPGLKVSGLRLLNWEL